MVEVSKAGVCDHFRFVFSSILLLLSVVVTCYAIVTKQTAFFHVVPGWCALMLFVLVLLLLGVVEGLQIALVELKRQHPDSYRKTHPAAYRLGRVAAVDDNVERFLVGRQLAVVVLVFLAAKLTAIQSGGDPDGSGRPAGHVTLAGLVVPRWCEALFLDTGLLACLTVVVLAQLTPQIVAAKFPVHFLQLAVMRPAYYLCVGLEATGLTHVCWCLVELWQKATSLHQAAVDVDVDLPLAMSPAGSVAATDRLEQLHDVLDDVDVDDRDAEGADRNANEKPTLADDSAPSGLTEHFSRFSCLLEAVHSTTSADTIRVLRQYLDAHPERFSQFPTVIGNRMYPAPSVLADRFQKDGYPVPKFLTDISHPEHIPPHIIACELLAENRELRQHINTLREKQD